MARWCNSAATTLDAPGYDLAGVFVGSEGHAGHRHQDHSAHREAAGVRRRRCWPRSTSTDDAGAAVSGIIAAGMLPAAIEMMDNLAIQAAEAAVHANYPDCGGLLLVELDGPAAEVDSADGAGEAKSAAQQRRLGDPRWRNRRQSARWSGRAAKPPSPPWAASRPTTSCRTA